MNRAPDSRRRIVALVASRAGVFLFIVLAGVIGYWLGGGGAGGGGGNEPGAGAATSGTAGSNDAKEPGKVLYACSMICVPPMERAGKCPICGMEMVPVDTEAMSDDGPGRRLRLSPKAERLAEIVVAPVTRKFVTADVRMVGKIDYDETRMKHITAWVPGRLDRLFIDYTGVTVTKGDRLVSLYSPELISAQEELFKAQRAAEQLKSSGLERARTSAARLVDSVREKLRLWGLTTGQIAEIERQGSASEHITILAPMSGVVIDRHMTEGDYVKTGTAIYQIADLSRVWVKFDAYESDLRWIRYGQRVEFETEAYKGEVFRGRIAFIDRVLDPRTRTVKVRVNVDNTDGRLKPEMFVRGRVRARIGASGKVLDSSLAGKWISPKHPEIIKDGPGLCDVCDVPLVRAETLGFVSAESAERHAPLVIPASAPLITGKRAVVYLKVPDAPGEYEGREIALGPRAGEHYIVRHGLREGEQVVVNGNFKIDSAMQILGRPSMMAPSETDADVPESPEAKPEARSAPTRLIVEMTSVLESYFPAHAALAADDVEGARVHAKKLVAALATLNTDRVPRASWNKWVRTAGEIQKSAGAVASAADLRAAREAFAMLSDGLVAVFEAFGTGDPREVLRFRCSMAFDGRGAEWLQLGLEVANPYFGSQMLVCGVKTQVFPATDPNARGKPQTHCPVMGNEIVRDVFTDHEGKRVYFCCPPCIKNFKEDPAKYLAILNDAGVTLEDAPAR